MSVYVIKNPAGTYSFVGRLPVALGDESDATTSDAYGGRAFFDASKKLKTIKFPAFKTEELARAHAAQRGVQLAD